MSNLVLSVDIEHIITIKTMNDGVILKHIYFDMYCMLSNRNIHSMYSSLREENQYFYSLSQAYIYIKNVQ